MGGMAGGRDSAFDGPLAPCTVKGSQISNGVVTVNVEGIAGGESSTGEPVFGVLGSGGRPLPPNADGFAESISARSADGLPVMVLRDFRIEKARTGPPDEGTVYLAGYYSAELRFDVATGEERSTVTLRDGQTTQMQLTPDGVMVTGPGLTQGAPASAQDVLLAQTAIDLFNQLSSVVVILVGAVNGLAPGAVTPAQLAALSAAAAPFMVGGSPPAPTTRAPRLRGTPGP